MALLPQTEKTTLFACASRNEDSFGLTLYDEANSPITISENWRSYLKPQQHLEEGLQWCIARFELFNSSLEVDYTSISAILLIRDTYPLEIFMHNTWKAIGTLVGYAEAQERVQTQTDKYWRDRSCHLGIPQLARLTLQPICYKVNDPPPGA